MNVASRSVGRRDLKEEILVEATRLFAAQGFSGTSVREVVEACGCTKPALYYYFQNKDELFRAVIDRQMSRMNNILEALHAGDPGPVRPRILAALSLVTHYIQQHPEGLRLLQRVRMQTDDQQPEFDFSTITGHQMRIVEELVCHGIAAGEVRADVNPGDAAMLLVSFVDFSLHRCVFDGFEWSEEALERCLELIFEGIKP